MLRASSIYCQGAKACLNSFLYLTLGGAGDAGGIAALSGLVASLPDDFDAPIVVAQHLDPKRESHLREILARKSPLPVKSVTEHEPLQAGMVEIYGYPPGEFEPSYEDLLERVHPDDRVRVRRTLDAAVAAGASHELEFRIVRPAGDVRWVPSKGRVHRDERGTPARVPGVSIDITEQKQAEQERERLHSLEVGAHAERKRISRELHDRVAHSMGVAHQSLQLYEALAEKDPVRAHDKLHTAREMTQTALEQTRNLSMELRRSETGNGLVPALQDLLEVAVPDGVGAELSTSGAESRLSDHQRGQLYLILREAVRNAVRHSGCRRLTVGLHITSEEVSGYVEDDGSGFEGNGEDRGGLGLRSIRERAALLEGTAEMYASQKGGAGVQVHLPLRNGVG